METVPGSGEAITVAVIVRTASGQSSVRQIIDPATLNAMFGQTHGKGMHWMVNNVVIYAQKELDNGVPVEDLSFALGGFSTLHPRDCVARDLTEVYDAAIRLCSGFVTSNFGRAPKVADASRVAFQDWASGVREALFATPKLLLQSSEFDVKVKLPRKTVVYGLVHNHYAANFAVLRPGQSAPDVRSLKVKLFDLESLRHERAMAVQRVEVLMGCPPHEALAAFSRREVDTFHETLAYIQNEAKVRDVALVRCAQHAEAANHIQRMLAA